MANITIRRRSTIGVVLLAVVAAGCLPTPPPWEGSGQHTMVFGDSLTSFIENGPDHDLFGGPDDSFLTDNLVSNGYTASVSSLIGANTNDLAAVTTQIQAPGADILLLALGSNDMTVNPKTGQSLLTVNTAIANISAAMDQVNADCNIVVTLAETTVWGGLNQTAPAYNEALRAIPGVYIADWASIVAAHPEYLVPNNVHLTAAGGAAYMELFFGAVDACAP